MMITIKEEFLTCTKLRRAIRAGGYEVLATWLAMKAYADRRGDGFIADEVFDDLAGLPPKARKSLSCLVECGDLSRGTEGDMSKGAGLVDPVDGGWELHDYQDHAASKEDVEERRRRAREKKARQRARIRNQRESTSSGNMSRGTEGDTSGDPRGDQKGDGPGVVPTSPCARNSPLPSSPLPSSPQDRSETSDTKDPTGLARATPSPSGVYRPYSAWRPCPQDIWDRKRNPFGDHFRNITEQPDIIRAFKRWQEVLGKTGAVLDEVKALTLEERQREGMTDQDLQDVLAAVKASDWYMAEPHRQQVKFLFGDRQRYETLLEVGRGLRSEAAAKREGYWKPSTEMEEAERNAVPMPEDVRERVEKVVGKLRGL